MKMQLITIVGPTAVGKTELAIKLANHFNTEIVSADSRQFYKELNIGTAKPTKKELESNKHHLIDNISISQEYNISQFEKELGVKTILMGFGLDSDAIHSPNEHFGLSNFYNGIETITNFYNFYSK